MSKKDVSRAEKLFEKVAIQIRGKITSEPTPFLDGIRVMDTTSRNYQPHLITLPAPTYFVALR